MPGARLVFTWNCPELAVVDSVVTVDLTDHERGTELRLTHTLPPDLKVRRGHEEGWTGCLRNLEKLLNKLEQTESEMHSIDDEVRILGTADNVYEALTLQAGYRGWWNAVAEVADAVGGEAKLRFVKDGDPVNMLFRIDDMKPSESVRWTCVAHDMPSSVDTTLSWQVRGADGATVVSLQHGGWKDDAPDAVALGWKHFLGSLKSYVETGVGQPW